MAAVRGVVGLFTSIFYGGGVQLHIKAKRTYSYTTTAIMLARYVTHMNTQSPCGICYASLEVGWYSRYQPTSTKA